MMTRRDLLVGVVIGAAVGLLAQPVFTANVGHAGFGLRAAMFLGFLALAPCLLFIASLIGRAVPVVFQFAKFAAVGTLNTFIDLGVFGLELLIYFVSGGVLGAVFKGISFFFATTNSFFWNKHWTFGARTPATAAETVKFYAVAVVGWALNVGSYSFVVNAITRPEFISPIRWNFVGALAGVATSFLWDFLGYKYLVFGEKKATAAGA